MYLPSISILRGYYPALVHTYVFRLLSLVSTRFQSATDVGIAMATCMLLYLLSLIVHGPNVNFECSLGALRQPFPP